MEMYRGILYDTAYILGLLSHIYELLGISARKGRAVGWFREKWKNFVYNQLFNSVESTLLDVHKRIT